MKLLQIAILLLFYSFTCKAQFDFNPDTLKSNDNAALVLPDLDSLQFEMRFWTETAGFSLFSQLTYSKHNNWGYRRGFLNRDGELTMLPELTKVPNLDSLWGKLDSLGILTLPSQDVVTVSVEQDGEIHTLSWETFDYLLPTHATPYTVELFSQEGYRRYFYLEPIRLSEYFKKETRVNWLASEHHRFAEIVKSMDDTFGLYQAFRDYLKSLREEPNSKGRKH